MAAFLLSAVWPGLGHFGHRNRRAVLLTALTLVAAASALLYFLTRDFGTWITWSVTRRWLQALIAAGLCVLVFRWAVAFDAYRNAARRYPPRGGFLRRSGTLIMLTVLALFIAAPHLFVVRLAATQMTLLSDVFDASETQTARPTPLPTSPADPATAAAAEGQGEHHADTTEDPPNQDPNAATAQGRGEHQTDTTEDPPNLNPNTATTEDQDEHQTDTTEDPPNPNPDTAAATEDQHEHQTDTTPAPADGPATTVQTTTEPSEEPCPTNPAAPTTAPPLDWDAADRLTIVLLGSDGGYQRMGVRTDTIIVLSIDATTGDAAAFNIPRNWRCVTFPEGTAASRQWPDGFPGIANEIYGLGVRYPDAFPDVEDKAGYAVKLALAQLTGLDIQYYVMVDMVGFVEVIDLFGGIDIHVRESINDRIQPIAADGPHIDIVVEPGDYHFDGLTALGYVRSRVQSTDWHRMTRQRCVIEALIDQVSPLEAIYRYVEFGEIISRHISTDIPLDRLEDFVDVADRLDTSRIVTVNFIPPEFPRGAAPIPQVRAAVNRALEGTANESNATLSESCQGRQ